MGGNALIRRVTALAPVRGKQRRVVRNAWTEPDFVQNVVTQTECLLRHRDLETTDLQTALTTAGPHHEAISAELLGDMDFRLRKLRRLVFATCRVQQGGGPAALGDEEMISCDSAMLAVLQLSSSTDLEHLDVKDGSSITESDEDEDLQFSERIKMENENENKNKNDVK